MRVLVITNMYPTEARPVFGTFVKDQVEWLRAAGVDADVLFIDGSRGRLHYANGIFQMRRMLRKGNYDLIHAHYVFSGWIARMQRRVPVVVTSHGSDTLGYQGRLLRWLYPLVDRLTITSRQNQERVGLPDTLLMPCATDTTKFRPMDRAEARAKLGWDADRQTMLYVGVDVPLKRLDVIRAAHAIVLSHRGNVDLYTAHTAPRDLVPVLMNASDVLLLASETEGAPVVVREAAACNLPVVSVDVGDVRELTEGMSNCQICERTPESMAEAVEKVLESGERSNGRDFIDLYGFEASTKKWLAIYESVLNR